ncbi:hypothetical protein CO046_02160 [Candidatus Peregrinibacteria bacterium CG_4_9_14_0_2_um_filter_53_11]|nr:MAG: hypothetical protein CO046_02160 [Candidatus Peregrinibacteria bacterium CG_4_9_14_0_2_um_filter_53_11]
MSSKRGCTPSDLQRTLHVSYPTALRLWSMLSLTLRTHRAPVTFSVKHDELRIQKSARLLIEMCRIA